MRSPGEAPFFGPLFRSSQLTVNSNAIPKIYGIHIQLQHLHKGVYIYKTQNPLDLHPPQPVLTGHWTTFSSRLLYLFITKSFVHTQKGLRDSAVSTAAAYKISPEVTMEELDAEEKAFQNKFSRQIATMGLAAVRKLVKMKVLIVGCGGVGAETAKNVILQGTRAVTLYDPVCQCCRSSLGVLAKLSEGRLNMQTSQQLSF